MADVTGSMGDSSGVGSVGVLLADRCPLSATEPLPPPGSSEEPVADGLSGSGLHVGDDSGVITSDTRTGEYGLSLLG